MTTFKKNTIIRIRRALLQVCYTQEGIVLMTGASSAEESTDIVADMHRNTTVGMEYNTNIRKKQKLKCTMYKNRV